VEQLAKFNVLDLINPLEIAGNKRLKIAVYTESRIGIGFLSKASYMKYLIEEITNRIKTLRNA